MSFVRNNASLEFIGESIALHWYLWSAENHSTSKVHNLLDLLLQVFDVGMNHP